MVSDAQIKTRIHRAHIEYLRERNGGRAAGMRLRTRRTVVSTMLEWGLLARPADPAAPLVVTDRGRAILAWAVEARMFGAV